MPLATIHKVGDGNVYHVHFLDQRTDPGFGVGGGPVDPGYGRPGGGHPDHSLPGSGGIPSHELPPNPPPHLAPGWTLVLIRHEGKWVYAAMAPNSPPPRPLPPGNIPVGPGQPGTPDQSLPTPPIYPSGGPVPSVPTPV